MDTNCNTDCDAIGEEPHGVQPVGTSPVDDCKTALISSTSYPGTPIAVSSVSARVRSGSPTNAINLSSLQGTDSELNHIVALIGDKNVMTKVIPGLNGRVIIQKEDTSFRIVAGQINNLVQLRTELNPDFVLGAYKNRNVCNNEGCPCFERIRFVKVPLTTDPVTPIVATDDEVETEYMTPVNIPVLANDSGDTISILSVTENPCLTIDIEMDGTITVTPLEGCDGIQTFDYTITDVNDQTDTATVTVNVGLAPAIEALDDILTIDYEDGAHNFSPLTNDVGIGLEVTAVGTPLYGTTALEMDGTITYTPPASVFRTTDSFTYDIEDDYGQTDSGTVNVNLEWDNYYYRTSSSIVTTVTGIVGTWRAVARYNTPTGVISEFEFEITSTALYDIAILPFKFPKVSGSLNVYVELYRPNGTLHSVPFTTTANAPKADAILVGLPTSLEAVATLD